MSAAARRVRCSRLLAVAVLYGPLSFAGEPAATDLTIQQPRSFGHFLGDVLPQRFLVGDGDIPDAKNLPRVDRVSQWLERRTPRVERDARKRTWLVIEYQVINSPATTRYASLPALELTLKSGRRLSIPEWPISIGPLLPPDATGNSGAPIQPDRLPGAVATAPIRRHMIEWGLAAVGFAVAWALWLLWRNQRDARLLPFAGAARQLSRLTASGAGNSPEAWITVHRALNSAAGRTVQGESLNALFERAPELAPLRSEIERFYLISSERFYARAPAMTVYPLNALCRRLRQIEKRRGPIGGI
jgi:mxaA protein